MNSFVGGLESLRKRRKNNAFAIKGQNNSIASGSCSNNEGPLQNEEVRILGAVSLEGLEAIGKVKRFFPGSTVIDVVTDDGHRTV